MSQNQATSMGCHVILCRNLPVRVFVTQSTLYELTKDNLTSNEQNFPAITAADDTGCVGPAGRCEQEKRGLQCAKECFKWK